MPDPVQQVSTNCDNISEFTRSVFVSLPRADQRRWAEVYINGALIATGRKSIRNIASSAVGETGAIQSLQQFINQSPWDPRPVQARLARCAQSLVAPRAWTVEHSVIPKRGDHSVGVAQRFVAKHGRTVNCQLAVGIFATSQAGSLPMGWRLHLPSRWLEDAELRSRARIPAHESSRTETELVLDMIDGLMADEEAESLPPLIAGVQPTDAVPLIRGLLKRSIGFLVQVEGEVRALWGDRVPTGVAPAHFPFRSRSYGSHDRFARANGGHRSVRVTPRASVSARNSGHHITSMAITLPQLGAEHVAAPPIRLIEARTPGHADSTFWVTNLPDSRVGAFHSLIGLRTYSEAFLRKLETELGLHDFEGRSFPGWHHHLTLISAVAVYEMMRKSISTRKQMANE